MNYVKLFNSILSSSIWSEPDSTRILWITMLAMADKEGVVNASVPGLSRFAGIPIEDVEAGLGRLLSPDPHSRTKDYEGRRLAEVEGGWRLLNHPKYRALLSKEERKEYNRVKQAEHRSKPKASQVPEEMSMTVNDKSALSAHTEAEAKGDTDTDTKALKPKLPKVGLGGVSLEEKYKALEDSFS